MAVEVEPTPNKPTCKYGSKCYRKNPGHLRRFAHPPVEDDVASEESSQMPGSVASPPGTAPPPAGRNKRRCENQDVWEVDAKRKKLTEPPSPSTSPPEPISSQSGTSGEHSSAVDSRSNEPQSGPLEAGVDATELEKDGACTDVREKVKRKFLVDMPEDFYQFWEFCKSIDPSHPECALVSSLGLELVGPYHVLAGRLEGVAWDSCVLHYRYFYDPPEMVTVLRRMGDQYHLGYFRDDPGQSDGALIASNDPSKGCEVKIEAQTIFAAVRFEVEKALKSKPNQTKLLKSLEKQLQEKMRELNLGATDGKTLSKQRSKLVQAKCLHKIGIVVPYDKKNDVGYRSLTKTDRELKKLLDNISQCQELKKRDQLFEPLQEIITYVQFANDECDYGMGLELGLDLFTHSDSFHNVVGHLLPLAYTLLGRSEYGKIVEKHLGQRQHSPLDLTQNSTLKEK